MISSEFEEELVALSDSELLRQAIKCLKAVYLAENNAATPDDAQEALDYIYMECSRRGQEWIFDKAQDACLRKGSCHAKRSVSDTETA